MKINIKVLIFATISVVFLSLATGLVLAQNCANPSDAKEAIQCGTDTAAGRQGGSPQTNLERTIARAVNLLSIVVGIIAVIMIIIGGLRYITSGGSAERVSGAKNTLIYAVIGLVIVALAQVIVRFVLDQTS